MPGMLGDEVLDTWGGVRDDRGMRNSGLRPGHICRTPRLRGGNMARRVDQAAGQVWTCGGGGERGGCGRRWVAVAVRSTGIWEARLAWRQSAAGAIADMTRRAAVGASAPAPSGAVRAALAESFPEGRARGWQKALDKWPDAE